MAEEKTHEHSEHHKKDEKIRFEISKVRIWQGATAILAIVVVFMWFNGGSGSQAQPTGGEAAPTPSQLQAAKFDIPSFAPYQGLGSAKIDIIEFGDYQCPFCERFFSQTEPQIMKNYVDAGKAKFYFLDFAFLGPDSMTLAEGAWCANDQNKYYEYHDYIYSNQGQEHSGWGTPDKVKAMAVNIPGLDTTAFGSCLDSGKYQSRVSDLTRMGQANGVSGTPSVFIGNAKDGYQLVVGAQPYQAFQQVIEAELASQ